MSGLGTSSLLPGTDLAILLDAGTGAGLFRLDYDFLISVTELIPLEVLAAEDPVPVSVTISAPTEGIALQP